MSEPASQSLKVSREGIVLIKSFEGFRPRAIRREDGGWVIGYGHSLSAREGATVAESDAELLLRYDLLPVEKAVNAAAAPLNQHQFDALVSFAHSVGLDRFARSDVVERLIAGAPGAAADALMGWPEPALPETALRRRAAERALFVADPGTPVTLADLLAAPLPPPVVAPSEPEPGPEPEPEPEPKKTDDLITVDADPVDAPAHDDLPEDAEAIELADPRGVAVAALLGEAEPPVAPPADTTPIIPAWPRSASTDAAVDGLVALAEDEGPADETAEPPAIALDPALDEEPETETFENADPATITVPTDEPGESPLIAPSGGTASAFDRLTLTRYSPYGAAIVGPLPYLAQAVAREPSVAPSTESAAIVETVAEPVAALPVEAMPVEATVDPSPTSELVLTSPDDAPEPAVARPLWTPADREEAAQTGDAPLFGEDLSLTRGGGPIQPLGDEPEAPVRFDWSETGAFIIMGGVGLTAFGASMAAFRLAAEHSGGDEVTLIAWVLAVIGAACVGVSSFNLYRRFGLPGGD